MYAEPVLNNKGKAKWSPAQSAQKCKNRCKRLKACLFWTWNSKNQNCWLKKDKGYEQWNQGNNFYSGPACRE